MRGTTRRLARRRHGRLGVLWRGILRHRRFLQRRLRRGAELDRRHGKLLGGAGAQLRDRPRLPKATLRRTGLRDAGRQEAGLARPGLAPTAGCVAISAADMRRLSPRLARGVAMEIG